LGVPGQNDIWVLVLWPGAKYTIRGKIVAFPQVQAMVSLVSPCLPVVHPFTKMFQLRTNSLFGLCRSMWVTELLINLRSPILELQHAPLPSKCCKPRSAPQFLLLSLFTFGFVVESIKELGGASLVANVSHNGWWKCEHVTWSHVCTLYISCNMVVVLTTHLQ